MTVIRLRRASSVTWAQRNPILLAGEPGVEIDTGYVKIGDGLRHWNSLSYTEGPPGPTGPQGPQGAPGVDAQWVALTQAQYDALSPPDPNTLYVIVE